MVNSRKGRPDWQAAGRNEQVHAVTSGAAPPAIGRTNPSGSSRSLHTILRYTFAAFIFTIPFETVELGFTDFTIAKMVGYLFFFLALLWPRVCFRRIPTFLWCFVLYLVIYRVACNFIDPQYYSTALLRFSTLAQCLILLWISHNLFQYPQVANLSLGALGASCFILAALQLTGVTRTAYHGVEGRMSAFQENPNTMGAVLSLGLISLVGLAYRRGGTPLLLRSCVWGMVPVIAIAIVDTGSRGSFVAVTAGVLTFVLSRGTAWVRFRNIIVALLILGVLIWVTLRSENSLQRWNAAFKEGSMAGRERIYPEARKMFFEKPLLGWGPVQLMNELGWRTEWGMRDTHNVFLWVLIEVGLLGAVPYFFGLWLSLRSAWKARVGSQGILPLALLLSFLVSNLSGTYDTRKLFWLILAYTSASGVQAIPRAVLGSVSRSVSRDNRPCAKPWQKGPASISATS